MGLPNRRNKIAHEYDADPDRLAYVSRGNGGVFSYPLYATLRDHNQHFDGLAGWGGITSIDAPKAVPSPSYNAKPPSTSERMKLRVSAARS